MIEPGEIIYETLKGIEGLEIGPIVEDIALPLVSYQVDALAPTRVKERVLFRNYAIGLSVFHSTYAACMNLAEDILNRFEAISGQQVDITDNQTNATLRTYTVRRLNAQFNGDVYEEDIGFGTDLTFNITINEV